MLLLTADLASLAMHWHGKRQEMQGKEDVEMGRGRK